MTLEPIPRRPAEDLRRYRRQMKVCTSYNMAIKSINYDKSTEELSRELADSFGLNADERYNALREMHKMRLFQKELLQNIRPETSLRIHHRNRQRQEGFPISGGWSPKREKQR